MIKWVLLPLLTILLYQIIQFGKQKHIIMKKLLFLLLFYFFLAPEVLIAQGTESFTNLTASGSSYGSGTYTGDNLDTWTYNGARKPSSAYNITGTSIGFGPSGTRNVSSNSGTNGVGDITFSIRSYFTGGNASNRTIEVFVGGVSRGSFTLAAMGVVETHTINSINEDGNVVIQFSSTGSRQIILDDVSWTESVGALPVTLTSFDAKPTFDNSINLTWQTASEENNDYFSIEHSIDGISFREIETQAGNGTTNAIQSYSFLHEEIESGLHYYRLKQVDFDEKFEYSNIITITIKRSNDEVILTPNPTSNVILIQTKTPFERDADFQILNMQGQVVLSSILQEGTDNLEVNVSNFPVGIYYLQLFVDNEVMMKKIIKH